MRNKPIPTQGGTGLEIVTWLGDLGDGSARLARHRATAPSTSVRIIFNNTTSDYGAMENLEGDVGGYLVASETEPGGPPIFPSGKGVADVIANYLPLASKAQWFTRASRFATVIGATVSPRGITNTQTLVDRLTPKLYDWAVWYTAFEWIG